MIRILFIEDEPSAIQPVVDSLNAAHLCEIAGFGDATGKTHSFAPDIVILDLLQGGATPDAIPEGCEVYTRIWDQRFCPIVVFSAHPELLSEQNAEHPFVKYVKKGMQAVVQLEAEIESLRPHVEAIRNAEIGVRKEFSIALRDVAPDAFRVFTSIESRNNSILRSAQRRLAARLDERQGEQRLQAWEQYLCPPVVDDLLVADVLKVKGCDITNPENFFVVLTPSCDLVCSSGRAPKVPHVLVAQCERLIKAITALNLTAQDRKLKEKLRSALLSQGYANGFVPLPKLEGKLPAMAANLRILRTISFEEISGQNPKYERVASIDSPFRELVSWAYMHTSCRLGLPDRDFDHWAAEVVGVCQPSTIE